MRFWLILEDIATEKDTNVTDVFMRLLNIPIDETTLYAKLSTTRS